MVSLHGLRGLFQRLPMRNSGDLVSIEVFGTRYLFINSYDAAFELLDKRGVNYSTRPVLTMVEL